MVAIPLLSGIVANGQAEFVQTFPLNLEPIAIDNKIASGQLRMASGAVETGTGPGVDRGGIEWNGSCYRVMGTKLTRVSVGGTVTTIGDVGSSGQARLDYSFSHLGVRSGTTFWLYNGTTLAQVTDIDLGQCIDMMWIDGFWMSTDGTSVVVTELSDPTSVLPLKYGSSEADPDPITGLEKLNGEALVFNRHTIQPFRNIGGNGFPFQAITSATIPYGCVSATAKCLYASTVAFVGSARNEALGVYVVGSGTAQKISNRTVDDALAANADAAGIILEARTWRGEQRLLVHLTAETWVYCAEASAKLEQPIWYRLQSGRGDPYRIRNAVIAYGKTLVGDLASEAVGELSDDTDQHFGESPEWSFDAGPVYNEGRGGIIFSLELVGLPGRGDEEATIFLSMTRDGQTWSGERSLAVSPGQRAKRMQWRPRTRFSNYIGQRFRGTGGMPGFARLEAVIEPLDT